MANYQDRYKFHEARVFYAEHLLREGYVQRIIAEKTGFHQTHISRIKTEMLKREAPSPEQKALELKTLCRNRGKMPI